MLQFFSIHILILKLCMIQLHILMYMDAQEMFIHSKLINTKTMRTYIKYHTTYK